MTTAAAGPDKDGGRCSRRLEDICEEIAGLCAGDKPAERHTVDPQILRLAAQRLLALSDRLTKASTRRRAAKAQPLVWQCFAILFAVVLTVPFYICVTYTSWFVDESFAIYRNLDVVGGTPIMEVLRHDFWGTPLNPPEGYNTHKSFRPLITLSYRAEWQLAAKLGFEGREMQPLRLVCCLIHSLNTALTGALLLQLQIPVKWSALGAALFAAHPVHVENLAYIVGRADSLGTTFFLLAVLIYLRSTLRAARPHLSFWAYAALVLLTSAAGLCKETCFTALFYLACAEVVLRSRWRHVVGLLLLFALVAGARTWYVGGTEAGFGYVDTPIRYQEAKLTRTLSYLFQHAYHGKLLVLPWNQSWDYSYDALPMLQHTLDVRVLAILTAYLGICSVAAHGLLRARNPSIILGLGLIVIPFVPASNAFFLIGTTVAERLLYPCTVGWSVLVAGLCSRSSRQGLWSAAVVSLLGIYVGNSIVRMGHWRSPSELFLADAQHWSRSAKVLHSVGSELQGQGDLPGALDFFQRSLEVFDDTAITDYCIARILINLGRSQEALARFDKILQGNGIGLHDGNDFLWMTDLGFLLVQLGQFQQAVYHLREGLNRMALSCYGWNALGVAYANMGDLQQALEALLTGVSCDSGSPSIWNNLALVYAYGNSGAEATEALQRALNLNASHPAVLHNAEVFAGRAPQAAQPRFDLYIPLPGRR